jgi:hypothetical protein
LPQIVATVATVATVGIQLGQLSHGAGQLWQPATVGKTMVIKELCPNCRNCRNCRNVFGDIP